MTILARNPDTGVARWVYQMTPHDEWDYDGVNEMILADQNIGGTTAGFSFTSTATASAIRSTAQRRAPGGREIRPDGQLGDQGRHGQELQDLRTSDGRAPVLDGAQRPGRQLQGHLSGGARHQGRTAGRVLSDTGLFYVPTNHVCMDYEPFRVSYTAGQPYVGATLSMYPPPGKTNMGNFIAWDARTGKIVWSLPEQFSVWSGALATAGGVVFYGTLEGYLKAVDAKTGKELYKFKTPSGIIGNVTTYEQGGKQYIAILSGVGGWAGIGLAAGLTDPTAGLGAVGGYAALRNYTRSAVSSRCLRCPETDPVDRKPTLMDRRRAPARCAPGRGSGWLRQKSQRKRTCS
jgi:glucose dehydrogenase